MLYGIKNKKSVPLTSCLSKPAIWWRRPAIQVSPFRRAASKKVDRKIDRMVNRKKGRPVAKQIDKCVWPTVRQCDAQERAKCNVKTHLSIYLYVRLTLTSVSARRLVTLDPLVEAVVLFRPGMQTLHLLKMSLCIWMLKPPTTWKIHFTSGIDS